jgi:hypothetical protein
MRIQTVLIVALFVVIIFNHDGISDAITMLLNVGLVFLVGMGVRAIVNKVRGKGKPAARK